MIAVIMSPLSQRGGDMLFYLCLFCLCVQSHSFLQALFIMQAVKQETLTQCRANGGPQTLSQHQPSIGLPCRVWRHAECGPASQTAGQH